MPPFEQNCVVTGITIVHLFRSPCKIALLKHGNPIDSVNSDKRGTQFDSEEHYKHVHFE